MTTKTHHYSAANVPILIKQTTRHEESGLQTDGAMRRNQIGVKLAVDEGLSLTLVACSSDQPSRQMTLVPKPSFRFIVPNATDLQSSISRKAPA
jgi:hypothetical protein